MAPVAVRPGTLISRQLHVPLVLVGIKLSLLVARDLRRSSSACHRQPYIRWSTHAARHVDLQP
jgi:hypothetical protein